MQYDVSLSRNVEFPRYDVIIAPAFSDKTKELETQSQLEMGTVV